MPPNGCKAHGQIIAVACSSLIVSTLLLLNVNVVSNEYSPEFVAGRRLSDQPYSLDCASIACPTGLVKKETRAASGSLFSKPGTQDTCCKVEHENVDIKLVCPSGPPSRIRIRTEKETGLLSLRLVLQRVQEELQTKRLIDDRPNRDCGVIGETSTSTGDCEHPWRAEAPSNNSTAQCCLEYRVDGNAIQPVSAGDMWYPRGEMSVIVTIPSLVGFDADVTKFLADMPIDPAKREELANEFWKEGITKKAHLAKVDPHALGVELPRAARTDLEETHEQRRRELQEGERVQAEAEREEARLQAAKMRQAAESTRKEIEEETRKQADQAHADAEAKSAATMNRLQGKLAEASLKGIELDAAAAAAQSRVQSALQDDAFVGGSKLTTLQLIRSHGLFRGVQLTSMHEPPTLPLQQAVQFRHEHFGKSDKELAMLTMLTPQMTSREVTVEATKQSSYEMVNKIVESEGFTEASSWSASGGVGISVFGFGFGASWKSTETSAKSENKESERTSRLEKQSTHFFKSKYLIEPRAVVAMDATMVEPTVGLKMALDDVSKGVLPPWQFRQYYGTHVCPHALLGAWMRISATYEAKASKSTLDLSSASSRAISSSYSHSGGVGLEGSGDGWAGEAGGGGGKSSKDSSYSGSGSRDASSYAEKGDKLEVFSEWRGGSSTKDVRSWRMSLERSSTWKIIDRYTSECIPNYKWAPDLATRYALCGDWMSVGADFSSTFCDKLNSTALGGFGPSIWNATAMAIAEAGPMTQIRSPKYVIKTPVYGGPSEDKKSKIMLGYGDTGWDGRLFFRFRVPCDGEATFKVQTTNQHFTWQVHSLDGTWSEATTWQEKPDDGDTVCAWRAADESRLLSCPVPMAVTLGRRYVSLSLRAKWFQPKAWGGYTPIFGSKGKDDQKKPRLEFRCVAERFRSEAVEASSP